MKKCTSAEKTKIVKLYYKEWCEELKRDAEAADAERAAMNEEKMEDLQRRGRMEVEAIRERMQIRKARTLSIGRPVKRMRFDRLSRAALKYAEEDPTDITIEKNGKRGVIRM